MSVNLVYSLNNVTIVKSFTFSQAWENWLQNDINRRGLTPSSLYKYLQCYRLINPIIGDYRIEDIKAENWQEIFLSIQETRGLSYKYINTNRNRVKAMYTYYMQRGYDIKVNPLIDTRLISTTSERKEVFTDAEKRVFLAEAKKYEYRWYLLFRLYFMTGCRRGELLALRWEDVDFQHQLIHIRHSISKGIVNGEYMEYVGKTKTQRSKRDIPISRKMAFVLRMIHDKTKPSNKSFVFSPSEYCHICKYPFISLSRITEAFALLRDLSGINPKLTIHSIRHYVATRLIEKGVDIATIQEIGGWSSSKVLLDIYAHTSGERKKNAMQCM
jgi:integrase